MYQEHEAFEKPEDENTRIWRYLDFTKFVSLLDRQALFFARADMLPDPFEGSYSRANIRLRTVVYRDVPLKVMKQASVFYRELRRYAIINCWHINESESAAMWKLYLKSDEGVAIQSTFKRLTKSFGKYTENHVFIGKVKYIDYEKEWLPEGNLFYPFLHKRKSFEHERELRAIIMRIPEKNAQADLSREIFDSGVYIPIDLDTLVERIFVAPTAAEWFQELTESIVKRYNLKKDVVQSDLAKGPVY